MSLSSVDRYLTSIFHILTLPNDEENRSALFDCMELLMRDLAYGLTIREFKLDSLGLERVAVDYPGITLHSLPTHEMRERKIIISRLGDTYYHLQWKDPDSKAAGIELVKYCVNDICARFDVTSPATSPK